MAHEHFSIIIPKDENEIPIKGATKTLRFRPYFYDPVLKKKIQRDFTRQFTGKVKPEYYEECERKYEKYKLDRQAEANSKQQIVNIATTVDVKIHQWLKKKVKISERHKNGTLDYIRLWITPNIGHMQITEVKKEDIDNIFYLMDTKVKIGGQVGLAAETKNHVLKILRPFFADLLDNDLIENTPCRAIKKFSSQKPAVNPPAVIDIVDTIDYMEIHSNPRNVLAVEIAKETGMRRSEIAGMTLTYWFPKDNVIIMNRTVTNTTSSGNPKAEEGGKSQKSVRKITVDPELTAKIEKYIADTNLKKYTDGFTYILQDPCTGKFLNPNYIGNAYRCVKKRLQKKGKIAEGKVGIHQMRHTQGTEMRRAGFSSDEIRKRLGHSSVRTTEMYYFAPDELTKEDDGLGKGASDALRATAAKQRAMRAAAAKEKAESESFQTV